MARLGPTYLPVLTALFIGLYLWGAMLYPGGSQHNPDAEGFSVIHNYWCNLFNEKGMNGNLNPGRPFAIASLFMLAIGLMTFWFIVPPVFTGFQRITSVVRWSGVFSMIIALFIFSPLHDIVTLIAGFFCNIAFFGIIYLLKSKELFNLVFGALVCVVLIIVNNIIILFTFNRSNLLFASYTKNQFCYYYKLVYLGQLRGA